MRLVMKKKMLRLFVFSGLVLVLAGCFGPKTLQEVTQIFWEAVLDNNVRDIVAYSTLTEPKYYDGFSQDWSGYQPTFRKVTIEDKVASVDTEFSASANSGKASRSFTTYLVLREKEWIVDYDRTGRSIHGGALGELFGKFNQAGEDLSRQLESSAELFKLEMERLGNELEKMSESFGQQASKSLDKYAEQLRENLQELEDSIDRALKDKNKDLTVEDKRVLREIANDLGQDDDRLSEPSVEAVTRSGKNVGKKQQQLEAIDNNALDAYKKEWRDLSRQYEEAMRQMMEELSSQDGQDKKIDKSF
jgi:hypothetical protein